MTLPQPVGRQMKARYAFRGAVASLERTAPLADGEEVLLLGAMRLHDGAALPRPVVLRLTAQRLTLLAHSAFGADQLWDLPRESVLTADLRGQSVQITWRPEFPRDRSMMQLTGWTTGSRGSNMAGAPGLWNVAAVADWLTGWLAPSGG